MACVVYAYVMYNICNVGEFDIDEIKKSNLTYKFP